MAENKVAESKVAETKVAESKTGAKKYVPNPEGLNLEFHQACLATGLVNLQECVACGVHRHPPRWYCPSCHSAQYRFTPVSGRGQIYSMAINHFTVDAGWFDDLPYTVAVVQLEEGPRIVGSLRDAGPGEVHLGDKVQVTVEPRGDVFAYFWVDLIAP